MNGVCYFLIIYLLDECLIHIGYLYNLISYFNKDFKFQKIINNNNFNIF